MMEYILLPFGVIKGAELCLEDCSVTGKGLKITLWPLRHVYAACPVKFLTRGIFQLFHRVEGYLTMALYPLRICFQPSALSFNLSALNLHRQLLQ
jgi:hypothetical protein